MAKNNSAWKTAVSFIVAALVVTGPVIGARDAAAQTQATGGRNEQARAVADVSGDQYFDNIYRNFYDTYKLGPADQLAIRVVGQPDYTLERAEVSPTGHIYHPLLGDVQVVGLTVDELKSKLSAGFSQYIIDPRVSVSLLSANSALIGVLGDITKPGIIVMSRPMTVLDAIRESGGVTALGSKSNVSLLRQLGNGRMATLKVNVKRILEGKASPEENVMLQAGDTLIVHGNLKKKLGFVSTLVGFGTFMDFILRR
jgi:polysaccharide export outer membrane protein